MSNKEYGLTGFSVPSMFNMGNAPITASDYLMAKNYEDTGSYLDSSFSKDLNTYQMPTTLTDDSWKTGTIFADGAETVTPASEGLGGMDWLNNNAKGLGTAASLAGLGMNAYSTFFGQGKDYFDKNMTLLNQQIASNKESMADKQKFQDTWANASNGLGKTA